MVIHDFKKVEVPMVKPILKPISHLFLEKSFIKLDNSFNWDYKN